MTRSKAWSWPAFLLPAHVVSRFVVDRRDEMRVGGHLAGRLCRSIPFVLFEMGGSSPSLGYETDVVSAP
ncbi:hypothetical protein [Nocardiopsis alba]|uniref:hypothetical protein n=1 Tax=Nocardiopsis alba TaxID=53437 RepID=UPI0012689B53|nr:hypothetical protein [Nocardiopsis alba]